MAYGRTAAVLTAAALVLALSGCPAPGTGPEDTAESTVRTLLDACAAGSSAAALPVLTPPARSRLVHGTSVADGCERVLGLSVENDILAAEAFRGTEVEQVSVDGGFGTATIRSPDGEVSRLELESRGLSWFVANPSAS